MLERVGKKGERMMPWQSYIFVPHDSGIFVCVCEMVVFFFPLLPGAPHESDLQLATLTR